jgi:hypothetical protein
MARVTAGVAMSHVPAIGAALDNGKSAERSTASIMCPPPTRLSVT